MVEEFEISLSRGAVPVPIGATGFTAKEIWETVMREFDRCVSNPDLKDLFRSLGDETQSDDALIKTVIEIINKLANRNK